MKEKIENIIKEVGINEVESILKQMKSKVNVKEYLKKDFIEMLTGCSISFDNNDIDYLKNGELLFFYRKSNNYFYFEYRIWLDFQSKYEVNNQELKELLVGIVEEVTNYKGVTAIQSNLRFNIIVEEVTNYKGVTANVDYYN